MDWFPDFMNYRRSVYPLCTDTDNEQEFRRESLIYETIKKHDSLLTNDIKTILGYTKKNRKSVNQNELKQGFDTDITRLQMGTWIIVADFEYKYNKLLERYGWGIARYTTPEALFENVKPLTCGYRTPEESKQRLVDYLSDLLPDIPKKMILKFIG